MPLQITWKTPIASAATAACRGVRPELSWAFGSLPASRSLFAASALEYLAARWSEVSPSHRLEHKFNDNINDIRLPVTHKLMTKIKQCVTVMKKTSVYKLYKQTRGRTSTSNCTNKINYTWITADILPVLSVFALIAAPWLIKSVMMAAEPSSMSRSVDPVLSVSGRDLCVELPQKDAIISGVYPHGPLTSMSCPSRWSLWGGVSAAIDGFGKRPAASRCFSDHSLRSNSLLPFVWVSNCKQLNKWPVRDDIQCHQKFHTSVQQCYATWYSKVCLFDYAL